VLPLFAFRNLLLSLLLFISVVVALVYFLAQKRNPFVDPGHPTFIRHQSHYFDYVKLLLPFLTVLFAHPLPDPTFFPLRSHTELLLCCRGSAIVPVSFPGIIF